MIDSPPASRLLPETLHLLDGGAQVYPAMLEAIENARRQIHLEMYAFSATGVGARFVAALCGAARRGVDVTVVIDGWGSAQGGRAIVAALNEAGCNATIHNRLRALLVGRVGRNHRKVLLVDDELAFIGGLNIGDENLDDGSHVGWADLALEIRGPQCAYLGPMLRGELHGRHDSSLRFHLCGLSGGWRMRRRYVTMFRKAKKSILVAHGYFLPDRSVLRAITRAARRGVRVDLLLAGRTDVPFARAATRSLYRRLLRAGVHIREWKGSVLHAKIAAIDGEWLLVGSFNLDPLSLANLEALVEVNDPALVACGEVWIREHLLQARSITTGDDAGDRGGAMGRFNPLGGVAARLAHLAGALLGWPGRSRRASWRGPPEERVGEVEPVAEVEKVGRG
ncbi:MAG: cardiolipin synthase B [Myxococcales bacterium]|nr:cardiolipin synthase B [Myxococcales bacterium]